MTHRFHAVVFGSALLGASWFTPATLAQQAAPANGAVLEELKALRQIIEQQSKQIDSLTAQVTRLGAEMERKGHVASAAAVNPDETAPPATAPAAGAPPTPKVVAAAGEGSSNVHIVVKGDSLEKIAKTHSTSVAELIKLNKITDPKKLQIGQQINLPPQPEKKEGQ